VIDQTIGLPGLSFWKVCRNRFYCLQKPDFGPTLVLRQGEEMARNFGVPQTSNQTNRGSLWPLMLVAFVLTGIVNVVVHLRYW
jgi:hypothetical protein